MPDGNEINEGIETLLATEETSQPEQNQEQPQEETSQSQEQEPGQTEQPEQPPQPSIEELQAQNALLQQTMALYQQQFSNSQQPPSESPPLSTSQPGPQPAGPSFSPQTQQPVQPQPFNEQELFGEEGFDNYNAEHHAKLIDYRLSQALQPFQQFIDQQQQMMQQQQAQMHEQQMAQTYQGIISKLDEKLPGFTNNPLMTTYIGTMFDQKMSAVPQQLQMNPQTQELVLQQVIAEAQPYYQKLGLGKGKGSNATADTRKREALVEGTNAVPGQTTSFDTAYKRGDELGMMKSLFFEGA